MTTFSLATAGLAFLLALAIGPPVIRWLRCWRRVGWDAEISMGIRRLPNVNVVAK